MLWFDMSTLWMRRWRKTGIRLAFQVRVFFFNSRCKLSVPELASWQRAHAGPPPGDISLRYPFFSCLCPRRLASKPTSCLAWQTVSTLSTVNTDFSSAPKADYWRCFQHGVKAAEKYWFLPHYNGVPPVLRKNEKNDTMQHACSAFFGRTTLPVLYFLY